MQHVGGRPASMICSRNQGLLPISNVISEQSDRDGNPKGKRIGRLHSVMVGWNPHLVQEGYHLHFG